MSRWLFLIALLPHCTGCLYYAYPTLSHTPELAVDNKDGSVHAFRIDIDRTERKPLAPVTQYTLTSIPLDSRGLIPSQLELAPATGVLNPLGIVEGGKHERNLYTIFVRLYKPGFRTMEVKAWEKSRELQWFSAPDLLAQEKAIDDLLADPAAPQWSLDGKVKDIGTLATATWWEQKDEKSSGLGLQPGSVSPSQRRALQFAATEYQRLASTPNAGSPSMQIARERLQRKADWLRRYAEQAPVEVR
jgi:hypothetical protein